MWLSMPYLQLYLEAFKAKPVPTVTVVSLTNAPLRRNGMAFAFLAAVRSKVGLGNGVLRGIAFVGVRIGNGVFRRSTLV